MNPPKRAYHCFADQMLERAVEAVQNGMSYRKAEQKFGVPKSSIQRKVKNVQQNPYGRPAVLNDEQEKQLSECLALAAEWGFPLTQLDVRCVVKRFLDKTGVHEPRFKDNLPGKKWIRGFFRRQSDQLKTRMCHNIKRARAAVSPEMIEAYFQELSESLKDVPREALINYDETSMQDNPGTSKVIVRRRCKHPERIIDHSKSNFSVMFAGTASGVTLPPYIVYKADNLYDSWTEGGPAGARYNRSKSGWFEGNIFEDWFLTIALPYLKKQGDCYKAIIGDNLASHISVNILQHCIQNNIRFILLPPNSTHLCQPLDLAFFSPLKTIWRRELIAWKTKYKGCLRKDQFPRLLKKTLDELGDRAAENLKAGFQKSGIAPLNKNKVLDCLPKPQEANNAASAASWTSSLEEYLKSTREKETKVNQRKKKIAVTPGKSLAEETVIEQLKNNEILKAQKRGGKQKTKKQETEEINKAGGSNTAIAKETEEHDNSGIPKAPPEKRKKRKQQSNKIEEDDSTDKSDNMSFHDSSSCDELSLLFDEDLQEELDTTTMNEPQEIYPKINDSEINDPKVNNSETRPITCEVNDFIVVKYTYDLGKKQESKKEFIGKILLKNNEESYRVSFMRNHLGSKNVFVFPIIEDIDDNVPLERVKRVIIPINESRGRFSFEV